MLFLALILKNSEKMVFEQRFDFSLVVFCSHAAISFTLIFTVFSIFSLVVFFDFLDLIFQMVFEYIRSLFYAWFFI